MQYGNNAEDYLAFLAAWKKIFTGDSFDFDYHLMWDINRDFGGEKLAKVIYDDVRALSKIGLNGFVSCQLQRAFYPNGLCFYILGRALAEDTLSYEQLKREYYEAAFGSFAEFARAYYERVEETVSFAYMREEISAQEALPGFVEAEQYLTAFLSDFPSRLHFVNL